MTLLYSYSDSGHAVRNLTFGDLKETGCVEGVMKNVLLSFMRVPWPTLIAQRIK